MGIYALTWVFQHSEAKHTDRLVLLALADYAHDDGSNAYPSVGTLAQKARVGKSTARASLRRLEEAEMVERQGVTQWGTTIYGLNLGAPASGGGQNQAGGRQHLAGGAPASGANPSREPSQTGSSRTARASSPPDAFPDDLPPELHNVALEAGKILKATAQTRGQPKAVTRAEVGHAVLTYPDRDHVQVARDVENWLLHGRGAGQSCRDVAARFRSFLKSSEPRSAPPLPGNVRPLRGPQRPGQHSTETWLTA